MSDLESILREVNVLNLAPDDVVVLKLERRLTHTQLEELRAQAKLVLGRDRKIAILDNGLEIQVLRSSQADDLGLVAK